MNTQYHETNKRLGEIIHEIKSIKDQNVLRTENVNNLIAIGIMNHEKMEEKMLRDIDGKITNLETKTENLNCKIDKLTDTLSSNYRTVS